MKYKIIFTKYILDEKVFKHYIKEVTGKPLDDGVFLVSYQLKENILLSNLIPDKYEIRDIYTGLRVYGGNSKKQLLKDWETNGKQKYYKFINNPANKKTMDSFPHMLMQDKECLILKSFIADI